MGGVGKTGAVDSLASVDVVSASGDEGCVQRVAKFISAKPDNAMDKRYVDLAFLYMIQDTTSGETEPVWPINKRLFREGESTPLVDDIRINDTYVIRLLGNRT